MGAAVLVGVGWGESAQCLGAVLPHVVAQQECKLACPLVAGQVVAVEEVVVGEARRAAASASTPMPTTASLARALRNWLGSVWPTTTSSEVLKKTEHSGSHVLRTRGMLVPCIWGPLCLSVWGGESQRNAWGQCYRMSWRSRSVNLRAPSSQVRWLRSKKSSSVKRASSM